MDNLHMPKNATLEIRKPESVLFKIGVALLIKIICSSYRVQSDDLKKKNYGGNRNDKQLELNACMLAPTPILTCQRKGGGFIELILEIRDPDQKSKIKTT